MEKKQLIISVGREFGSGGHEIAAMLAKRYQIPLYDYNILSEVAKEKEGGNVLSLEQYDEVPKKMVLYRTVKGYSNSPSVNVAQLQFEFLLKKAKSGESFVVVGRCADEILKEFPGLITIFVLADMDKKIERIMEYEHNTPKQAKEIIERSNKKRKQYHNYFCEGKWGDSRNYELSINSSKLGLAKTEEQIAHYIDKRLELM